MAKPIKIVINGPAGERTGAPTTEDFLNQIRDILDVLQGVEKAAMPEQSKHLVWRVTDATMNSPITLELTPFGDGPAADVAAKALAVERAVASGFRALRRGEARPDYFTAPILDKARKIHARVMNGLSDTVIKFDPEIESEPIVVDRRAAKAVDLAIEKERAAASMPYRELGSVEGYITKPELDGHHRAILRFKSRMTGAEVKAFASGEAFTQLERMRLSDVWHGARVRVYGLISYKSLGQIEQINATAIEILGSGEDLPTINDIIDENFTGGLISEEFLSIQRGYDG